MNPKNITFKIVNPLEIPKWNSLIQKFPQYTIFHSNQWYKVLVDTFQYRSFAVIISDKEKIKLILPFFEINSKLTGIRGISLPFTDFCDPLTENDNYLNHSLDFLLEFGKKEGWKYLELRTKNANFLAPIVSEKFVSHDLNLIPDEQKIFDSFRSSTKRNIKKAIKYGVLVEVLKTEEALRSYFDLHSLTRKKHGLPPQPFSFFDNLLKNIIKENQGFIVLAQFEGEIIAGGIFLYFSEKGMYKFGASNANYQNLRANNLIFWEAIKYLKKVDCTELNFGKTSLNNNGLIQFKNGWGVTESNINYFKYNFIQKRFIESKSLEKGFHNAIFNRMPISLLKFTGSKLYKHMA